MTKKILTVWLTVWSVLKYFLLAAIAVIVIVLILLASAYSNLSEAAVQGLAGKKALSASVYASQSQAWDEALRQANEAQTDFSKALAAINASRSNSVIRNINLVRTQINDLEYLLKTAEILTRSLQRIIPIAQELSRIQSGSGRRNFNDLAPADKVKFLQLIYQSEPELNGLRANINIAILNLDKIHKIGILWPLYGQISNIKSELTDVSSLMKTASPLIKLLPALAGYPEASRFLLIMQNSDELRPSGGFIGVYGILEIKDGEIISLTTDDSYHLDMPASQSAKWNLEPPAELKKYLAVEKWYLRDANWFADWSQSAKKVEEIYSGENAALGQVQAPFTGVIAITPDFVADLIDLVGPITVRDVTYKSDNFQPLLQYNVEVAYKDKNISQWDRKDIVNELMDQLKTKLLTLPAADWKKLFSVTQEKIASKSLQLYLKNSAWENLVQILGADGQIAKAAGDYLMVVDANLGALKSDAVVKKNIAYSLSADGSGLQATLKLGYSHEGGFDWRTTRYRSYTKVYVPRGSKLVSLQGIDESTRDLSVSDEPYLDKTSFNFFFTVEPGSDKEITLVYRLPDFIKRQFESGQYQLLVQKQSGQRNIGLNIKLQPRQGQKAEWKTELSSDKIFSISR